MAAPEPELAPVAAPDPNDAIVIGPQSDTPQNRPIADYATNGTREPPGFVSDITQEFVKSYGFRRDDKSGEWGWSVENITRSFQEDPFWTTLDYVTLLVPAAKWGLAATKIAHGSSAFARAVRSGHKFQQLGGRAISRKEARQFARGRGGRGAILGRLTGTGRIGPVAPIPTTGDGALGRVTRKWLSTTSGAPQQGSREWKIWEEAIETFGASESDSVFMQRIFQSGMRAANASMNYRASALQRSARGLTPDDQEAVSAVLSINREAAETTPDLLSKLDWAENHISTRDRVARHAAAEMSFRNDIHEKATRLEMISEVAAKRGFWDPRVYARYADQEQPVGRAFFARKAAEQVAWFGDDPTMRKIVDQRVLNIEEMKKASVILNKQEYMTRLANSPLTGTPAELRARYGELLGRATEDQWMTLNESARKFYGERVSSRKVQESARGSMRPLSGLAPGREKMGESYNILAKEREKLVKTGLAIAHGHGMSGGVDSIRLRGIAARMGGTLADRPKAPLGFKWNADDRLIPVEKIKHLGLSDSDFAAAQEMAAGWAKKREKVNTAREALRGTNKRLQAVEREMKRELMKIDKVTLTKHLSPEVQGMYIDPAVAEDIAGALHVMEPKNNPLHKLYAGTVGLFQSTHTAYNPATTSRNFLGNIIFTSFALGLGNETASVLKAGPLRGWREIVKMGDDFQDFTRRGGLGGSFASDVKRMLAMAMTDAGKARRKMLDGEPMGDIVNVLDELDPEESWLGFMFSLTGVGKLGGKGKKAQELASAAGGKIERFYSAMDDVWKMHAFSTLKNKKFKDAGLIRARELFPQLDDAAAALKGKEIAGDMAMLEIARYMPNYGNVNPLIGMIRDHVPFASFPAEATRIWKNAMTYKPHVALAWNQMADNATHLSAAVGGFSKDEVEAARESLPYYTAGKQMAMMPFRTKDGKPQFLDLTYLIPMSDMGSESQMAENKLFGMPLPIPLNVGTNPIIQFGAAALTGTDPFSEKPIAPRMYDEVASNLGLPSAVEPMTRRGIGLAEALAKLVLPPVVPPGYVGTNLWHLWDGTKSGVTGAELKQGAVRTVLTELAGLRTYEPTVQAQIINLRQEKKYLDKKTSDAWNRWEFAQANSDLEALKHAEGSIRELRKDDPAYFDDNYQKHLPGGYMTMSPTVVSEVLYRSSRFKATPEELFPLQMRLSRAERGRFARR